MILHVFNPEHDIALAAHLKNFTAPHAGRQLRHDLGFLPALWAEADDVVLVDDIESIPRSWRYRCRCRLVEKRELVRLKFDTIEPWGWDLALRATLVRYGVDERLLPSEDAIEQIRVLSHRRVSAWLLPLLRVDGTVGEAFECTTADDVDKLIGRYGRVVLKAPWSSSGRGLRFVTEMSHIEGWLKNLLATQGSVMLEPYYNKVKDFGMEFYSDGNGNVGFLGLSLFHTANGAYTGNVLATENAKREWISDYLPTTLLDAVQEQVCRLLGERFRGCYCGPFGIDMMIVARDDRDGFLLHPCVEINLRRTMGHVALSLSPSDDEVKRVMRIDYSNNNYKLIIRRL